jgi:calcium-dependent protein kinase
MLIAINYLHQNQVVHRDIKLENFLYEDASESAKLKLIDFGFSKVWEQRERLQASCGSIQYVSPEVLRSDYDSQCDLWSLGVIVFMLLAGYPPFEGAQEEVLEKIRMGRYKMKENRWDRISSLGKDFVTKLLIVDPQERLTAGQALAHPWISQRSLQEDVEVPREVLENIRIFAQFNHLKRAALSMLAYTLTSDQLSELHKVFLAMDLDKEGTIQLSELVVVMQTQLGLSPEEIHDIFGKLDRSNQGKIEYTSFLAASMASRLQLHDDLIRHVFNQLDHDKDGFISLDDLRCVLGPTIDGQDVQVCIIEADINGDGRVNFDEFEKCFLPAVLEPKTSLAKLRAVSALSRVRSRRSLSCESAISGVNV